jgi:hypothetical protein
MKRLDEDRRRQRAAVFVALLMFQTVLLLIQLWLFVSLLEGKLDGSTKMGVTAMFLSAACFAANVWMLVGVWRLDRGK